MLRNHSIIFSLIDFKEEAKYGPQGMASLIRLVSLSLGLLLCCLESLVLLQVWLCSRMSKSLSLGDVLMVIKHRFHAPDIE
jgi:hypothetical protein